MFHKHNNVTINVSLFLFFSASMCTSPQTTSETGRTVWRCNILLLSYVFCKQPLDSLICCHVNLTSIGIEPQHLCFISRYFDNKVFVSLANGEVIVYQREAGEHRFIKIYIYSFWSNMSDLQKVSVFFLHNRKFLGSSEFSNAVSGLSKRSRDQNGSRGGKTVVWLSEPDPYCQHRLFNTRGQTQTTCGRHLEGDFLI